MFKKLIAKFECADNGDGTYRGIIAVDGQPSEPHWRIEAATKAEMRELYLAFVMEQMVCPTVRDACVDCLPTEFLESLNRLGLLEGHADLPPAG